MKQPEDLVIDIEKWGDMSALRLQGRLNPPHEQVIIAEVHSLMAQGEIQVVIDCASLDHINSRSVSTFIACVDELRGEGGDLKLIGVNSRVMIELERLGISKIIQVLESLEEAMEAFRLPVEEYMGSNGITTFMAGSKKSVFHAADCPKLPRDKVLRTFRNKTEARASGRTPCSCCEAWFLKK